MNTVILTSVLSAGNHALFAGTRVLYGKWFPSHLLGTGLNLNRTGLAVTKPPQAPRIFAWTTPGGVPLPALLLTSSISGLCFGSSFIGSGQLWSWLQNIVGVSNQVFSVPYFLVMSWSNHRVCRSRGCLLGSQVGGLGRHGSARGDP